AADGARVHLVVPTQAPASASNTADGEVRLLHLMIAEGALQVTGVARFPGLQLPAICSAALRLDEQVRGMAALLAVKVDVQATPEAGMTAQPWLLSARFSPGASTQGATACGEPLHAMPRASAVAFSLIASEPLQPRAAVVTSDGRLLLSDNSGQLQA